MLQNGIDGGQPRTDHLFDTDGRHQGKKAKLADPSDDLTGSHATRQQGGQNIGFLVIGQGNRQIDI